MVAIEVSLLTGRYSATSHYDREQPEWPPHGARLFSAMVAAWAEQRPPDARGRSALEWLESLPPPRISASEAVARRVVSHFVPVNDTSVIAASRYRKRAGDIEALLDRHDVRIDEASGMDRHAEGIEDSINRARDVSTLTVDAGTTSPDAATALLPQHRVKKERFFPSVTPVDPVVAFSWDQPAPLEVAGALERLLARVTRLGHSSSLVSCRLLSSEPEATHVPGSGTTTLRWVMPGQLSALEHQHRRHRQVRPRSLPFRAVPYRAAQPDGTVATVPVSRPATAGDWIVFELEHPRRHLLMTRTVELAAILRDAVMHHAPDPIPEGLSGHRDDGRPTTEPHAAFLSLPDVGLERSDGHLVGLAIALPAALDDEARLAALVGVGMWEQRTRLRTLRLTLGRRGVVGIIRRHEPFTEVALRPGGWSRTSRRWASATPVALPRHPGNLTGGSLAARAKAWQRAEQAVLQACEHVGLPEPVDVQVSLEPFLNGASHVGSFPAFKQGTGSAGGTLRRLAHVSILFADPVSGPLMLGSGRFSGLGLMRPILREPVSPDDRSGGQL